VALAAAALASPYLLVRKLRRRRAQPTSRWRTRRIPASSAIPVARSLRRQTVRPEPVLQSAGVHRDATKAQQR
jgi:hypothetical protein